ncbi:scaffold/adaptor protein [Lithospermum erythrorhizon]|uniref:Scaffold/adaptor protein n=1 Tax=Lithospermum erythrorhizon TaxID=34254 RepID=A0AAV3P3P4_LITER
MHKNIEDMKTRRGWCYPKEDDGMRVMKQSIVKRRRDAINGDAIKKWKQSNEFGAQTSDYFDVLPDDLVTLILCNLSSSASSPADFINVLSTCRRLKRLALNSIVLSKGSLKMISVRANKWSDSAHRFLKLCADAGNVEACYTLGMIRFYCLQNRGNGTALMAKAAISSHALALYSLAVIQFNGSGVSKRDKDLHAGVALCARAAFLGHIDALRELGHCLQDGYGVKKNITEGRKFLVQANARELASVLATMPVGSWIMWDPLSRNHRHVATPRCALLSDFGCNVPPQEAHPANRFLIEWFEGRVGLRDVGLRLCSHTGCGRPETRRHEFRRCSICGSVNYCSRACQALDWKIRHKAECVPLERWLQEDIEREGGNINGEALLEDGMILES